MAYTEIDNPGEYFNTKLYTGNGSTQSITDVGFKPDWTWIKPRAANYSHNLTDIVRGVGKGIFPDLTATEYDYGTGTNGSVRTFDSDGFSLGSATQVNPNGVNIASWNWLAGGSQGSSNTDGTINTTYTSANTTSGFSIVTYTGTGSNATVGHGLGAVPTMIIAKEKTGSANDWTVYHVTQGNTTRGILNESNAWGSNTAWNNTTPTSSVFSIGSGSVTNRNNSTYIAYCFSDVKGFSRMGSYTGNGNTNGSFIYTGFSPAWLMIKQVAASNDWFIIDNKREPFNPNNVQLVANTSGSASTNKGDLNLLSNGFKPLSTNAAWNENNAVYVYMAFAQNPFVTGSSAIPTTAR